jgi:hypothetical protein
MKKYFLLAMLTLTIAAQAKNKIEYKPMLQQCVLYFASDRITMGGFGMGAGIHVLYKEKWVAQTDASLLWANGNTISTRLALGYQRGGKWTPAIMATVGLLWGQRTEILDHNGRRPIAPVWVAGMRSAALKFANERGYVSALEIGCGIGPYKGTALELTILAAGINW